jgi:ABC-2 type transport system permease protein
MVLMSVQSSIAFLVTAFLGPNTIAPDLANNALPLYFCRPLSRAEYVLGRAAVLLTLLSVITWIPGLAVFGVEATLSGGGWAVEHWRLAAGILVGSFAWIVVLTLFALALSAWVRWKVIAGALLLGVMFFTSGFAAAVRGVLNTTAGFYADPSAMVAAIFTTFFGVENYTGVGVPGACISLAAMCALCVYLLSRKVRAFEVIR